MSVDMHMVHEQCTRGYALVLAYQLTKEEYARYDYFPLYIFMQITSKTGWLPSACGSTSVIKYVYT